MALDGFETKDEKIIRLWIKQIRIDRTQNPAKLEGSLNFLLGNRIKSRKAIAIAKNHHIPTLL